jgi:hypothetical protein
MTKNIPAAPTRQAVEAKGRTTPGRVTGKLKAAIDRMVWFGDKRADAATAAVLTDHGLRSALRKPHVLGHLRSELALLREGERPRSIHRLAEFSIRKRPSPPAPPRWKRVWRRSRTLRRSIRRVIRRDQASHAVGEKVAPSTDWWRSIIAAESSR